MAAPVVDIFIPCFMDQLFPETGFNMVKVLEKLGCEVHYNPNQTCCGQPAMNAGYFNEAREVAEKFMDDFKQGERYVVAPSASCIGMVCNSYARFFENTLQQAPYRNLKKRSFEFTEFITGVLKVNTVPGARLNGIATYHDSCSALRECHIFEAPRTLLAGVAGLELREMADNDNCCGFGGTFAVKFDSISTGMAAQKADNALATGAKYLITTDSSCIIQLDAYIRRQKMPLKCMHIADVLAQGW